MDQKPRSCRPLPTSSQHRPLPQSLWRLIKQEFEITWRMLADNALASATPVLMFVLAVCARTNLPPWQTSLCLAKACVLAFLYTYVFDVSNQATSADEDRLNKPYRPIPRKLLTPQGALKRFWIAAALYACVGWAFGVLRWASLWIMASVVINLACPPRHYFWCKTLCMVAGVGSQLSQAWELVTPLDAVGKRWIIFLAVVYTTPLIFEDVRDMAGDKAVGRRTLALMLGDGPIRAWFASTMMVVPLLVHVVLFKPAEASAEKVFWCTACITVVCWTMAIRAVMLRDIKSDRRTYQGFISSYVMIFCCGHVLWR